MENVDTRFLLVIKTHFKKSTTVSDEALSSCFLDALRGLRKRGDDEFASYRGKNLQPHTIEVELLHQIARTKIVTRTITAGEKDKCHSITDKYHTMP